MKKLLLAAIAALSLSGCVLLDDEFWDDGYDSSYDYPSDDDCDCDDY